MTKMNFKRDFKHILDFDREDENFIPAKIDPKEEGYYMTIKCGLGGLYYCLNEFKDGKWQVLSADDSYVVAYSREPLPKDEVDAWIREELDEYKKKNNIG